MKLLTDKLKKQSLIRSGRIISWIDRANKVKFHNFCFSWKQPAGFAKRESDHNTIMMIVICH